MLLDVSVLSPKEIVFEGKAKSVILPGEAGVFEVLPLHKRLLGRLVSGVMFVDNQGFRLQRGIAMINQNKVTVVIEERE